MRPDTGDAAFLWDMLDAARAVRTYTTGRSFRDYASNRMLRDAVERNLEIIGEAAGKVSREFRVAHSEIPWQALIGQRNVFAHQYGRIRDDLVWNAIERDLVPLVSALELLIEAAPGDPEV